MKWEKKRRRMCARTLRRLRQPDCPGLYLRDTELLALPLWTERDLYALLAPEVRSLLGLSDTVDFAALRQGVRGDTLEEIYAALSEAVGADVTPLAAVERRLMLRLLHPMVDVVELLLEARKLRKRVCLACSRPLMQKELRDALLQRGLPLPDAFVSAVTPVPQGYAALPKDQSAFPPYPSACAEQNRALKRLVEGQHSFVAAGEADRFLGFRAMMAVAALHRAETGKADPGFEAFGPYLLSHALWLAEEMRRGGFERLNFLARDGAWVKQAFDCVNQALHLPVQTGYVRVSRKAVFPLHFASAADWLSLPALIDLRSHTPRTLLTLLAPVLLRPTDALQWAEKLGIRADAPLSSVPLAKLLKSIRSMICDASRFSAYRDQARAYFAPFFAGKCAVYDVGYNLRSEQVLKNVTGADITAFVTHIDSDTPLRRDVSCHALYGASPWVSWVAREQFLLEDAPSCVAYNVQGPVLEADYTPPSAAVQAFQRQGMAFVQTMVNLYGDLLPRLSFRYSDGCAAFERFLHEKSAAQRVFRGGDVENNFHSGNAGEPRAYTQWRLMQTDFLAAKRGWPRSWMKPRRAAIMLREEKEQVRRRLLRRK